MAYVNPNYRTKWAVIEHFRGKRSFILQPENKEEKIPREGEVTVRGPRPPEGPIWEATFILKKGKVVNVQ